MDADERKADLVRDSGLRQLLDRYAIGDALACIAERLDAYDIDGAVGLFADDCVTDYGSAAGGRLVGRQAFRDRLLASQGRFERTHHHLGQVRIDIDGESASSVASVIAGHIRWDGGFYESRLQYHDRWTKTAQGWVVQERRALTALVTGTADAEAANTARAWVPRKRPADDAP